MTESRLITSDYGGEGCDLDTGAVMRWEYLEDDFNKYDEVIRHPLGIQTLHEVTGGEPERSRVYREYMAAHGLAQEMLVSLRARTGDFWGILRLNRALGQPEFDRDEIEFMARVAPDLAEGVRLGLLVGEATDPDLPDAPGLVFLDADGEIDSLGPGADRWIAELPGRPVRGPLPASVAAVASAAFDGLGGNGSGRKSSVRVRSSVDGRWISVHGSVMRFNGTLKAAVIIEPAHHDRIAPLLMTIYGLTSREQEVTRLVLRGASTARMATDLGITPYTVQEHLKRVFEKTGVHSRRELVGTVFFDNFDPRVQDNGQRVRVEKPIRGGPFRAVPDISPRYQNSGIEPTRRPG